MSLLERFNCKVIRLGEDDCWQWLGSKDQRGYGRIGVKTATGYRSVQAQRVSWGLFVGIIPPGMFVCHHCDNPECTNPKHLFTGTHRDNMKDMREKRRSTAGWQNKIKTHCIFGHAYTEGNTYLTSKGHRSCRTCRTTRAKLRNMGIGKGGRNIEKTICKHGHPFNEENTYVSKTGSRLCKRCDANRKYKKFHLRNKDFA